MAKLVVKNDAKKLKMAKYGDDDLISGCSKNNRINMAVNTSLGYNSRPFLRF